MKTLDIWGNDMIHYLIFVYGACFALIAGGAFGLMLANVRDINNKMSQPPSKKHPEAPEVGEEVMYVDLSREKLEKLYEDK